METLLITGAAGNIGAPLRPRPARPGRVLRLFDIAPAPGPGEEVVAGPVTDPAALAAASAGVDAVPHPGGLSHEAPWADILAVNAEGTRTVPQAAADADVPRVPLASSGRRALTMWLPPADPDCHVRGGPYGRLPLGVRS